MDNRSLVLFLSGLAAAGTAVCIAVSCSDQPRNKCQSQRGQFNAAYELKTGDADGGCLLTAETIGVESYNPANSDRTNADLTKGTLAIKGGMFTAAGALHPDNDPDTMHNPNSVGAFTTAEPDSNDFCNVPTLNESEQSFPFIPAVESMPIPDAGPDGPDATDRIPAADEVDIKYAWSNVKVKVTPSFNGLSLAGDLTYTTVTRDEAHVEAGAPAVTCTATYRMRAIFGAVACDDFCACLPYPDPANMRNTGSGFSPDLFAPQPTDPNAACEKGPTQAAALEAAAKVTCDTKNHLCVLKGEVP